MRKAPKIPLEWLRHASQFLRRRGPRTDSRTKVEAIRAATRHAFPTAVIDRMLAELGSGHLGTEPY